MAMLKTTRKKKLELHLAVVKKKKNEKTMINVTM